jgi:glycolate oxidase iron-sulfur subunit
MAADAGEMTWADARVGLDTCLGCRACETACPSAVHYGTILEEARTHTPPTWTQKAFVKTLTNPSTAIKLVDLSAFAPSRRLPAVPGLGQGRPQADSPQRQPEPHWGPLPIGNLPPVTQEVYLLRGCLAGSLFPTTLAAVTRLLRRVGVQVRLTPEACCGSMLAHNGLQEDAAKKMAHLHATMPDDLPLVTFTAGCGSHLREEASPFADRAVDITEFLLARGLTDHLTAANGVSGLTVTYHDACHLAHGQKVRSAPRQLLAAVPGLRLIELKESDMCCGSAGTYNVFQPTMARKLLERKWENIAATGAHIVAQGNAGCHSWIAQAARERGSQIRVMHTAEVLESAFSGLP